ncbi:uncharacterized protein LOC116259468 [Nymphaea colorata]|nr:uncharacterized protein LOC116259468 [Nymphaea colorata]
MGSAQRKSRCIAILMAVIAVAVSFKAFMTMAALLMKLFTFFLPLLLSTAAVLVIFRNAQVPGHVEEQWLEEAGELYSMILGPHDQTDPFGLSEYVPWDDHG